MNDFSIVSLRLWLNGSAFGLLFYCFAMRSGNLSLFCKYENTPLVISFSCASRRPCSV